MGRVQPEAGGAEPNQGFAPDEIAVLLALLPLAVLSGERCLTVTDESGQELGTMTCVEESPASDLWVVRANGRDVLVPAVRDIVVRVDIDGGTIVLHPPEGLF